MKKYIVVAILILCAFIDGKSTNRATVTSANGKFTFTVTLDAQDQTKQVMVELSVFEDFSRVRALQDKNKTEKRTLSVSETAADEGDYYWRVKVSNTLYNNKWIYPRETDVKTLHFTGAPKEYVMMKDDTEFKEAEFDDGTKLNLSSVWLRSHVGENHTYRCTDKPIYGDYKNDPTFNHGLFVKDGIIYLCRGSYMTAGWDSDHSRVWLLRYDLATGEELPMLWVYAPDNKDFPAVTNDANVNIVEVMPWIRYDDDGTVYFSTSTHDYYNRQATLYSIDLDGVTLDTHSVTAKEELTMTIKEPHKFVPYYLTVKGSIKSGKYEVWGAAPNNIDFDEITDENSWEMIKWTVDGKNVTKEISEIRDIPYLLDDCYYEMMTYPMGDNMIYMHGKMSGNIVASQSPALYRFNAGGTCEMLGYYEAGGLYPEMVNPRVCGMAMPVIDGKQLLIYGVTAQGNSAASAAKIVYAPSHEAAFAEHKELWQPGDATGFSTNKIQGIDAQYIPDESEHTGGILVLYLGNGALGVYRVDVTSPTVSTETPVITNLDAHYDGTTVSVGQKMTGMSLYDMQGRCIASEPSATDRLITGRLAKGIYLITDDSRQLNSKLIIY